MFAKLLTRAAKLAAVLPALMLVAALGAGGAHADVASAKAAVDAAKSAGIVGEQGDGYVGFVKPSSDDALKAAVAEINAGRKSVYQDTAAKTGVSLQAAGEATAKLLFDKMPAGQYYKPLNGDWTTKK